MKIYVMHDEQDPQSMVLSFTIKAMLGPLVEKFSHIKLPENIGHTLITEDVLIGDTANGLFRLRRMETIDNPLNLES